MFLSFTGAEGKAVLSGLVRHPEVGRFHGSLILGTTRSIVMRCVFTKQTKVHSSGYNVLIDQIKLVNTYFILLANGSPKPLSLSHKYFVHL